MSTKQLSDQDIQEIVKEVRSEQRIHPLFPDESIEDYVRSGIDDIDKVVGKHIDYDEDLQARTLLKMYVFYANHNRIAEFREVYLSEYTELQIRYY